MIGIIGAMDLEIRAIKSEMESITEETVSGVTFCKGRWMGRDTVIAVCGIGKVFAAICTEAMILRYQPDFIINTGVAGSLDPDLHLLQAVVADQVVQHDMDTSPIGDPKGMLSGINRIFLPADPAVSEKLLAAAAAQQIRAVHGTVASGDQFIAEAEQKVALRQAFNAVCCEMEGASIGHVCYVNRVPFAVLRVISDNADGGAEMDFPAFAEIAAKKSIQILKTFFKGE